MRLPMMRAFTKYSSLCTITRNASDASASSSDTATLIRTMAVLEIRLPATGISPATKVSSTSDLEYGTCRPSAGSTPIR